jgi:hypothetical protein
MFIMAWPALIPVAFVAVWVLAWKGTDWLVQLIEYARDARARAAARCGAGSR